MSEDLGDVESNGVEDLSPTNSEERLQKVLARTGFGSRRVCEDLISEGRVTVNGEIARLGRRISEADSVAVDGVSVSTAVDLAYYLLNKPVGIVCTAKDPQGRKTVVTLVPQVPRVFSVGRLDAQTEGLIILTNDGEFANLLTHPSFGIEKEYLAQVEGNPSPQVIRSLRKGVELEDGMTAPAKVSLMNPSTLKIVIHEGRNRQVRRMCDAVGYPVVRLIRVRIGSISDRRLAPGQYRQLTASEIRSLFVAASTGRREPSRLART